MENVVKFAQKTDYINLISGWSLIRDHKQTKVNKNDLPNSTGIIQEDYDFLKRIMKFI